MAEKRRGFSRWIAADEAARLFAAVRELLGGERVGGDAKLFALVGLARRAGFVEVGLRNVLDALARGEGGVVVMARDISQRGGLSVTRAAHEHDVPQVVVGTRVLLGVALGAGETVAALVLDPNAALGILRAAAPNANAGAIDTSGSSEPGTVLDRG
ncbi:MAG: L7Ae/L30e/S12e/Gadd45 family ribosomal protein [bacterium]